MLFAKKLVADCKGESIFQMVKGYMDEKQIPLSNILSCATDGAAAMVGRYKGFIGFLKAAVPDVHTIHCMVHRQHLVAKKLAGRLHDSLTIVIRTVNFIHTHTSPERQTLSAALHDE